VRPFLVLPEQTGTLKNILLDVAMAKPVDRIKKKNFLGRSSRPI
jgi:hypothetical protein